MSLSDKHESDLTSKEKRQLEREKWKSMNGRQRLTYFLDYYKWVIVLVIAVIFVIYEGISIYHNARRVNLLSIAIVDTALGPDTGEPQLQEDLLALLSTGEPYEMINLDTAALSGDSATSKTKLLILTSTGTTDIMICPESVYREFDEQGAFVDWKEILSEEDYEKGKEHIDGTCLRLDGLANWERYGLTLYEPVCATLIVNSERREQAGIFAQMVLGLDPKPLLSREAPEEDK